MIHEGQGKLFLQADVKGDVLLSEHKNSRIRYFYERTAVKHTGIRSLSVIYVVATDGKPY